jgi:hydroxyethylthiazole kinase-like uncharacterized protein yjeF
MKTLTYTISTLKEDIHKGQVGKVLVIGGSPQYHGAPILTALGVEAVGSDLIYLYIPLMHAETAKNHSLNFFISHFIDTDTGYMGLYDVKKICEIAQNVDAIVIGNGLSKDFDVKKTVLSILNIKHKPIVIDADALVPEIMKIYDHTLHNWILTPHCGEFKRLFDLDPTPENIKKVAIKNHINICVKGYVDYIIVGKNFAINNSVLQNPDTNLITNENILYKNKTGIVQMKVGGTGDVLAGMICGYLSQGLSALESMKSAVYLWGKCGERMCERRSTFSAASLIKYFPKFLAELKNEKINQCQKK